MEISEVNPDGNVYQLKDSTARAGLAQIAAQNTYSTTEVDTGKKWTNGKTIYRKVFSGTYTCLTGAEALVIPKSSMGNVEDILFAQGYHTPSANRHTYLPNFNTALFYISSGEQPGIYIASNVDRTNVPIVIWYEYTKV